FGVSGSRGDARAWIATDTSGEIIINQQGNEYDFSGFADGEYTVYYMRWQAGNFGGLSVGNNLSDLTGCFDLSNGIVVTVFNVNGGVITTEDETTICLDDTKSDVLTFGVSGSAGNARAWIVTDENGKILVNQQSNQVDFSGAGAGICVVYYMRWQAGNFGGLEVGNNLTDLTGCFDLSNGIYVERLTGDDCDELCNVRGGTISTDQSTDICINDTEDTGEITFGASGSAGEGRAWIATDDQGLIVINQLSNTYDFTGFANGDYGIYFVRFDDRDFSGLELGNTLADLEGCFDVSNRITVSVYTVNGGIISTDDPTTFCIEDDEEDIVRFSVSGSAGEARAWVVTDDEGEILLVQDNGTFDFTNTDEGKCVVYYLRWQPGNFSGLTEGEDIYDLDGCFDLSNGITVTREDDCEEEKLEVVAFYLINAQTNEVIQPIEDGATIDIDEIGTDFLSIQAITNPEQVGSVRMRLRGRLNTVKTENFAPYMLFGDNIPTGNVAGRIFRTGNYTVEATPYEKSNLRGERGEKASVRFSLVKQVEFVKLTVLTEGEGSVSISPKGDSYKKGSLIRLVANPDRGYRFYAWTDVNGRVLSRSSAVLILLSRDFTLKAVFVKDADNFAKSATLGFSSSSALGLTIIDEKAPVLSEVSLFPNPIANDLVNIKLSTDIDREATINVIDITGRTLLTQQFDRIYANDRIELDLSGLNLKAGTYLLQIQTADQAPIMKQFIKQ
ncbi:MAG: T9SS type A sorting domain-containing protein, partial [Bacteroidota bacterium]